MAELIALFNSGSITFDEFRDRSDALTHPLEIVSRPGPNNAPLPPGFVGHNALLAPAPPAPPIRTTTAVGFSTGTASTGMVTYVYERPFTGIKIRLVDNGAGLTAGDIERVKALLARLPAEHLQKLPEIEFKPGADNQPIAEPTAIPPCVNVHAFERANPNALLFAVANAVGYHVYRNVLSAAERSAFQAAEQAGSGYAGDNIVFASRYARYVDDSIAMLTESLTVFREGTQDAIGSRVLPNLFMASVFGSVTTSVANLYRSLPDGTVQQSYAPMSRTADQITVGSFTYRLQNGALTGVVFTNGGVAGHSFGFSPVRIPAGLLNRIRTTSR